MAMIVNAAVLVVFLVFTLLSFTDGFAISSYANSRQPNRVLFAEVKSEADELLEKARELRASIAESSRGVDDARADAKKSFSEWNVENPEDSHVFRLSIDIGREEGTWMEPRWGASGNRIELTLDVGFSTVAAGQEAKEKMVKDNFGGKSSQVFLLKSAPSARLRRGFDRMKAYGGAYRTDTSQNGMTARFYIDVEGTPERGSTYGDISIPKGQLYFSLPCFNGISQLSSREGIVTVRQVGWHTGWRREESRIVGTFLAVPIEKAQRVDNF